MKSLLILIFLTLLFGCNDKVIVGVLLEVDTSSTDTDDGTAADGDADNDVDGDSDADTDIFDTSNRDSGTDGDTDSDADADGDTDTDSDADGDTPCVWADLYDTVIPVNAVWGTAKNDVYVGGGYGPSSISGDDNIILHFNGNKWSPMNPGANGIDFSATINGIWGIQNGVQKDVYFGHDEGIHRFDGANWHMALDTSTSLPYPLDSLFGSSIQGIWGRSANDVYAAGGLLSGLPISGPRFAHFDGLEWSDVPINGLSEWSMNMFSDVWGTSNEIYVVTRTSVSDSYIVRYRDGDWGWVDREPATAFVSWPAYRAIWGRADDDLYAVGTMFSGSSYSGFATQFNGSQWDDVELNGMVANDGLRGVWGEKDTENLFFVGGIVGKGLVLQYDGSSWTELLYGDQQEPFAFTLNDVWGDEKGSLFIVGERGIYYCLVP